MSTKIIKSKKPRFRLGRHINTSLGFVSGVKYAHDIGCEIMQVFLGPPNKVTHKAKKEDELVKFGAQLKKYDMQMVIHGSYSINFCHPPDSARFKASIASLVNDLKASEIIGPHCLGVIIHMGKNIAANKLDTKTAYRNYIDGLKTAIKMAPVDTTIILETGASQGAEIGSRLDGLQKIYDGLNQKERKRIAFCVDTCHIWASGYDISTVDGVKYFFAEFDKRIGVKNIICIHFNDSKNPLNSHVDRHADLGYGYIKTTGLQTFARTAKKYKIPLIMETPLDAINPKTNQEVTFAQEFSKLKSWFH